MTTPYGHAIRKYCKHQHRNRLQEMAAAGGPASTIPTNPTQLHLIPIPIPVPIPIHTRVLIFTP